MSKSDIPITSLFWYIAVARLQLLTLLLSRHHASGWLSLKLSLCVTVTLTTYALVIFLTHRVCMV
jgi:hypothetical protein